MLDLYHDVVVEFIVKTVEELDSGIGTVGLPVALVKFWWSYTKARKKMVPS
jgi:hypothetical protein